VIVPRLQNMFLNMQNDLREAVEDYKKDFQSALWNYGHVIEGCLDEIEQLEKSCSGWANVSQTNFQLAKRYEETLDKIAKPRFGLQSIQEKHENDTLEYYKEISEYYRVMANDMQKLAREDIYT